MNGYRGPPAPQVLTRKSAQLRQRRAGAREAEEPPAPAMQSLCPTISDRASAAEADGLRKPLPLGHVSDAVTWGFLVAGVGFEPTQAEPAVLQH